MKKMFHKKATYIFLILMMIWSGILLFARYIPYFLDVIDFVNIDDIKDGIIGGYVDDFFLQTKIIYHYVYSISTIIFLILTLILLIISFFKPKTIKAVGITIIIQNITLLLLKVWELFFVNINGYTIVINIKWYMAIIVLFIVLFIFILTKQKSFYVTLGIVTLLQGFNTMIYTLNHFASIIISIISSIKNYVIIFQCFGEMFTLIFYWMILLSINKSNKSTISTNE